MTPRIAPLKRINFHEDKTLLLVEKIVNIQFLLPFPQFDVQIQKEKNPFNICLANSLENVIL